MLSNSGILADKVLNNSVVNNITVNDIYVSIAPKLADDDTDIDNDKKISYNNDSYGLLINDVAENSVISNINVINGRYQVNGESGVYAGIIGTATDSTLSYISNSATITSSKGNYLAGIVAKSENSYLSFLTNEGLIYSKGQNEVHVAGISVDMNGGSISFSKNLVQVQAASDEDNSAKSAGLVITNKGGELATQGVYMLYCFNDGKVVSISSHNETVSAGLLIEPNAEDKHIIYFSYNKGAMLSSNSAYALTNMEDSKDRKTLNIDNCYSIGGGYSAKTGSNKIDLFPGGYVGDNLANADTINANAQEILDSAGSDFMLNNDYFSEAEQDKRVKINFPINRLIDKGFTLQQKDEYYQIETPFELYYWMSYVCSGNVQLLKDIDMSGYSVSSISNVYTGTFDGNNHAISNLQLKARKFNSNVTVKDENENEEIIFNANDLYAGFILQNAGTITNVHFVDPQVSTREVGINNYIGVVAGKNIVDGEKAGTISNVLVSASYNGVSFININYTGKHNKDALTTSLTTSLNIGVICGQNDSSVTNCEVINLYNGLTVNVQYEFEAEETPVLGLGLSLTGVSSAVGGLVGINNGKINNSAHFGAINIRVKNTGRIGNEKSDFLFSLPVARLDSCTGPIAGYIANADNIEDCYAKSNLVTNTVEGYLPTTIISYSYENAANTQTNNLPDLSQYINNGAQAAVRFIERKAIGMGAKAAKVAAAKKLAKKASKQLGKYGDDALDMTKALTNAAKGSNPVGWALMALDILGGIYNDYLSNIANKDINIYDGLNNDYLSTNKTIKPNIYEIISGGTMGNVSLLSSTGKSASDFDETDFYILSNFFNHKDVNSKPKEDNGKYYIYSADEFAYALLLAEKGEIATFVLMNSIDLTKRVWETDENYTNMTNITVISNGFEVKYGTTLTFGGGFTSTTSFDANDDFGQTEKIVRDAAKIKMDTFNSAFKELGGNITTDDNKKTTYEISNSSQLYLIGIFLNTYDVEDDPVWKVPLTFRDINFELSKNIEISSNDLYTQSSEIVKAIANDYITTDILE